MDHQPRRHHYVPEFYLKGFTLTGLDDAPLVVTKLETGAQRDGSPKSVAFQRDYHIVNIPGVDPMHVEKGLAQLEGKWATLIRAIESSRILPSHEGLGDLFIFVSFMAVRVPDIREKVTGFVDQASKLELTGLFSTPEGRQTFKEFVEQQLPNLPFELRVQARKLLREDPDMKETAAFAMSGQYDVAFDQTSNVQTMLHMAISLVPVLATRHWSLWTLEEGARDLTCSDRPVCLTWVKSTSSLYPPGFGCRNTLMTIPLTRRLAVASSYEQIPRNRALSDQDAEYLNARTAMFASETYAAAAKPEV